ncbi:GlcG/HbpS family heme-binding protein [Roseiterribacter gracilis]|uniref:GlcG protein n=1 Tax=Roseiterribacter gracilis TaxID=2812848 RepID=A0A8S8XFC3_9PROT|nr:hypothetical protein TMPK1_23440 [Rhodospirillales bacterium TMPK1]
MDSLSLDQARTMLRGVFAKSAELQLKPLACVVLDAGGILIAYERQDGSSNLRFEIARGKAYGALGVGVSSRAIATMANERPVFVQSLIDASNGRVVPAAGGLLVRDASGRVLGAVGVTGDTSDNDERCAAAGIEAAGLLTDPVPNA